MAEIPVLEPAPAEKSGGKSKRKLLFIIIGAVVVLGAAGGWFMLAARKSHQPPQAEAEPPAPALYVALDPPFVVNFEARAAGALPAGDRAAHVARPADHRAAEDQRPGRAQ